MRESWIERNDAFEVLDLFIRERDLESFYVCIQMFDLAASNDWKYVWCLLHDIRNGDGWDAKVAVEPHFLCDFLECMRYLCFILSTFPRSKHRAPIFSRLAPPFFLRVRAQFPPGEDLPWGKRKAYTCFNEVLITQLVGLGRNYEPSSRAIGMISRSKERSMIFQAP